MAVRENLKGRVANDPVDQAANRVLENPSTISAVSKGDGRVRVTEELDDIAPVVDELATKISVCNIRSEFQIDAVEGAGGSNWAQLFKKAKPFEFCLRGQVAVAEGDFDAEIQRGSNERRVANDGLDEHSVTNNRLGAAVRVCEGEVEVGIAENKDGFVLGVENLAPEAVLDFKIELDSVRGDELVE